MGGKQSGQSAEYAANSRAKNPSEDQGLGRLYSRKETGRELRLHG